MIGKFIKYLFGIIVLTLLVIGITGSFEKKAKVEKVVNQLNKLVDDVTLSIGKNPSVENLKNARQIIDERKNLIRTSLKILKDEGMVRNYTVEESCLEPNKCSEAALEIDACFRKNYNRISSINDSFLRNWNEDVEKSNELFQKIRKMPAGKESNNLKTEMNNLNEKIEVNIALMDELTPLIKSFVSITNEEK